MGGITGVLPSALQSVTMAPALRLTLGGVDGGAAVDPARALYTQPFDGSAGPSMIRVEDGEHGLRFAQIEPERVENLEPLLRDIANRAPSARCSLTRKPVVVLPRDSADAVVNAAVQAALHCAGLGFDSVKFYMAGEDGGKGDFLKRVPVPLCQPIFVSAALVNHADPEVLVGHLATYMQATSAAYEEPVAYDVVIDDALPGLDARSAFLEQLREARAFGAYDAGWLNIASPVGLVGGAIVGLIGLGADSAGLGVGGGIAMLVGLFGLGVSEFDAGAIPQSLTLSVWEDAGRLAHMGRCESFWRGTHSTWK